MRPRACLLRVQISEAYESQERRFNYTTPKSFLELIALYKKMLAEFRAKIEVVRQPVLNPRPGSPPPSLARLFC